MVLLGPTPNSVQLQANNKPHRFITDWVVGHDNKTAKKCGGKNLKQGLAEGLTYPFSIRPQFRVFEHLHNKVGADVAGQQNDCILEIYQSSFGVFHPAFVEHLEKYLVDVAMRLLDLVEQNNAVRTAPDRLSKDASFAIADVSGR